MKHLVLIVSIILMQSCSTKNENFNGSYDAQKQESSENAVVKKQFQNEFDSISKTLPFDLFQSYKGDTIVAELKPEFKKFNYQTEKFVIDSRYAYLFENSKNRILYSTIVEFDGGSTYLKMFLAEPNESLKELTLAYNGENGKIYSIVSPSEIRQFFDVSHMYYGGPCEFPLGKGTGYSMRADFSEFQINHFRRSDLSKNELLSQTSKEYRNFKMYCASQDSTVQSWIDSLNHQFDSLYTDHREIEAHVKKWNDYFGK